MSEIIQNKQQFIFCTWLIYKSFFFVFFVLKMRFFILAILVFAAAVFAAPTPVDSEVPSLEKFLNETIQFIISNSREGRPFTADTIKDFLEHYKRTNMETPQDFADGARYDADRFLDAYRIDGSEDKERQVEPNLLGFLVDVITAYSTLNFTNAKAFAEKNGIYDMRDVKYAIDHLKWHENLLSESIVDPAFDNLMKMPVANNVEREMKIAGNVAKRVARNVGQTIKQAEDNVARDPALKEQYVTQAIFSIAQEIISEAIKNRGENREPFDELDDDDIFYE
jgi:hypothetical protein